MATLNTVNGWIQNVNKEIRLTEEAIMWAQVRGDILALAQAKSKLIKAKELKDRLLGERLDIINTRRLESQSRLNHKKASKGGAFTKKEETDSPREVKTQTSFGTLGDVLSQNPKLGKLIRKLPR